MICVDMMARFIPSVVPEGRESPYVRGTVVYVNYALKCFKVEWEHNGVKYFESFNFDDCGKTVTVRGY